eukprot:3508620-Amphidinium_carterae.1
MEGEVERHPEARGSEEVQAGADRVLPMELEVPYDAPEQPVVGPHHTVVQLRARLQELRAPTWGPKALLLNRVREYEEKRRKEHAEQQALARRHDARLREERVLPAAPVSLREPVQPTEAERQAHLLTHMPTASWCETCVAAKAKSTPHFQMHPVREQEARPPVVEVDYIFMANRNVGEQAEIHGASDEDMVAVITALDQQTGMCMAAVLQSRAVDTYQVELMVDFLE